MTVVTVTTAEALRSAVRQDGYVFVKGAALRDMLTPFGELSDWRPFAGSWDDLRLDTYMADGGRYRRRRYGVYEAAPGSGVRRVAHQPHFQPLDYNPLNGGVARWFEPIAPDIGDGATMRTVLAFCRASFGGAAADGKWHIEVHQFRIEARAGEASLPTPEGLHRDGVDYALVLLVQRRNIAEGTTSIHAADGRQLGAFTLTDPLDAALLDDRRVSHGVTPVQPIDAAKPAYRDVLVVTFSASRRPA
jgi:hypothetical protein